MKTDNITQKVSRRGTEKPLKILPEENLDKLVDRFQDKRYKLATRLIYRGGLRPSEGLELTWGDLVKKEDCWEAEITTGLADRTVFLNGEKLDKLLQQFIEDEGEVFDFNINTYTSKLQGVTNGEIKPYTLRRSKAYTLAYEDNGSAERLSDELGFSLPTAENRTQEVKQ